MDLLQILGIIIGNGAIIVPLWLHLETKMDQHSTRIEDMMKDFHGRLCALEERSKKIPKNQQTP